MKKNTWIIIILLAIIVLVVIFWSNIKFTYYKTSGKKENNVCKTDQNLPGIWKDGKCVLNLIPAA